LEAARRSLERTGLFLLGEPHGVEETPRVLYTLVCRLGVGGVALEWSHDELDPLVLDLDLAGLWALPPSAEAFAGDGRITAGHFALLRRLREEGVLEQVILIDRVGSQGAEREWAMAERLLTERHPGVPLLAVVGDFHARFRAEGGVVPMAVHVAKALPGVGHGVIRYRFGSAWHRGVRPLAGPAERDAVVFEVAEGHPATVPART
jgi:hypothetical protein